MYRSSNNQIVVPSSFQSPNQFLLLFLQWNVHLLSFSLPLWVSDVSHRVLVQFEAGDRHLEKDSWWLLSWHDGCEFTALEYAAVNLLKENDIFNLISVTKSSWQVEWSNGQEFINLIIARAACNIVGFLSILTFLGQNSLLSIRPQTSCKRQNHCWVRQIAVSYAISPPDLRICSKTKA